MSLTIDKNAVKKYLKIDAACAAEDDFIEGLIFVAKNLIEEQTGVTYDGDDEVYKMAVLLVVQHYYDNRTSMIDKSVSELPFTMDCLIKHIGIRGAKDD